ncbi:MAG: porin [Pirellulales bacterium]
MAIAPAALAPADEVLRLPPVAVEPARVRFPSVMFQDGEGSLDESSQNGDSQDGASRQSAPTQDQGDTSRTESEHEIPFYFGYDDGLFVRPIDENETPYSLNLQGRLMLRHSAFSRDTDTWTDNAGVTREIRPLNAFEVERMRLILDGTMLHPDVRYYIHFDADTDDNHTVELYDASIAYDVHERLTLEAGKAKMPGSRQFLLSSFSTRLADRPMATDFFRPDRTVGAWAIGELGERVHYHVMAGNGYVADNLTFDQINSSIALAGTMYWDPVGDFGETIVDFDISPGPLWRLGHSFSYASQSGLDAMGDPLEESRFVRLTGGTRLTDTGALAPGVTVDAFDIYLYALDVSMKYRGWSANAEYYARWLQAIEGDGPLPHSNLYASGYFVEGGFFILPQRLGINARYSHVSGLFGEANEYAAGVNWYPTDSERFIVTFDVTMLDGSPLDNDSSNIFVGMDGTLFRTQVEAVF